MTCNYNNELQPEEETTTFININFQDYKLTFFEGQTGNLNRTHIQFTQSILTMFSSQLHL